MKVHPRLLLLGLGALLIQACGGGGGGGGESQFTIVEASNGFGRLLPHQIAIKDAQGMPTNRVIEITRLDQLVENATSSNPIKPPTEWPTTAVLPDNQPGNHFFYVRFSQEIEIDSVLAAPVASGVDSNLTTNIQVLRVEPTSGATVPIVGRGFVGGKSYGPTLDPTNSANLLLETWVSLDPDTGDLVANTIGGAQPGLGFPGTESGFAGDDVLVDPRTFVFVVDEDGDLSRHETFPAGYQIQMRINGSVRSVEGRTIEEVGLASSTVGADTIPPEVLVSGATQTPVIIPGNGEADVDPETNVEVQFTEPIQPLTLGELPDDEPPTISAAIQLRFGPSAGKVDVPFHVRPFSIYDLSRYELIPAYNFPGSGPQIGSADCGAFGTVDVHVNGNQFQDLSANRNTLSPSTFFTTREGAGVVNAPVTPDTIYVGRGGSNPGISVIDLNGFGQGTGNPTYDLLEPIKEGNTNFPNNPNVSVQGSILIPPLTPGTCTFNGGSEGVFTLAKDSSLNDLLARAPLLESVGDMAIGHALDNVFNNSAPFGCQAGGGNICATTGLKEALLSASGTNSLAPSTTSTLPTKIVLGGENLAIFAPHPNPPPLVFPPLCLSPLINGLEPTSVALPPGVANLLVPGPNSRGNPEIGRPPTNLLSLSQNFYFDGPSPPQPLINLCLTYRSRQQVGHFLYVVDRSASELVVLNSNRFTVLDRIRLPDPTSLAMSPNLDLLAVTNERADQVSFVDIDPSSATFHQIVRTTPVSAGPTGIAWETGNEDIFVCCQADGTVNVISAFSLRVRKVLRNQISRPIDVALTPRQLGFGFMRGVYFGYVLNQNGTMAIFESGPDGINGWGFDDIVASLPFPFFQPKAIQPDVQRLNSGVWVVHENPLTLDGLPTGQTGGAVTNVGISSATPGIVLLQNGPILNPELRNIQFGIFSSVGEGPRGLSGLPVDIAFDNQVNVTALTNYSTQFSAGVPLSYNGKSIIKFAGAFRPTSTPAFMFLAVPNPGVIDVFELTTGTIQRVDTNVFHAGLQSIPAANASVIVDYLRQ
jgi:hypothetical protein